MSLTVLEREGGGREEGGRREGGREGSKEGRENECCLEIRVC